MSCHFELNQSKVRQAIILIIEPIDEFIIIFKTAAALYN